MAVVLASGAEPEVNSFCECLFDCRETDSSSKAGINLAYASP
jgi:hypothetical protein